MDVEAGKDLMMDLLRQEGKYVDFMRAMKRGDMKRMEQLSEWIIAKHREKFNDSMGITGGQ